MIRRWTLHAAVLLAWGCAAQVEPLPEADLILRAARSITGSGPILQDAVITVRDGRFDRVDLEDAEVSAPRGVELGSEYTLLPGFIETHAHLLAHPTFERDSAEAMAGFRSEILPGILEAYLEAGFTTVLDNGSPWPDIAEVREQVRDGGLVGPRIFTLGPVLTAPNGHPAGNIYGENTWGRERGTRELDDPAEARAVVRRLYGEGVDGIKAVYDGNPQPRLSPEVLQAIAEEAASLGLPVFVHAGTAQEAVAAIEAGASRLVHAPTESSVEGTPLSRLLVERDLAVSLTLGGSGPGGHFTVASGGAAGPDFETTRENVRALASQGVRLAYGTDNTNVFPARQVLQLEVAALESAGLGPERIIAALTRDAAVYLFREAELGTIEPGKRADLVVVRGNPLEDPSALADVAMVIRDGGIVFDSR